MRSFNDDYTTTSDPNYSIPWAEVVATLSDSFVLNPLEQISELATFEQIGNLVDRVQRRFEGQDVPFLDEKTQLIEEELLDSTKHIKSSIEDETNKQEPRYRISTQASVELINSYFDRIKEFYKGEHELCVKLIQAQGKEAIFTEANITSQEQKDEYLQAAHILSLAHDPSKSKEVSESLMEYQSNKIEAEQTHRKRAAATMAALGASHGHARAAQTNYESMEIVNLGLITDQEARSCFGYSELGTYNGYIRSGHAGNLINICRNARDLGLMEALGRVEYQHIDSLLRSSDIISWATNTNSGDPSESEALRASRIALQKSIQQHIMLILNNPSQPLTKLQRETRDTLNSLNSHNNLESYSTPPTLNHSAQGKVDLLLSDQARKAYTTDQASFDNLKDLDEAKIKLLISDQAIKAYNTEMCYSLDLNDLDETKIKLLISDQAIKAYETRHIGSDNLSSLNDTKIKLLISDQAIKAYSTHMVDTDFLPQLDDTKIKLLISDQAIKAYNTKRVTSPDLQHLDQAKFDLLISDQAIKAYSTEMLNASNLTNLNDTKIKLLISDQAIKAYHAGQAKFSDLKDLAPDRIKQLIGYKETEVDRAAQAIGADTTQNRIISRISEILRLTGVIANIAPNAPTTTPTASRAASATSATTNPEATHRRPTHGSNTLM